jgi:type VII secretion protein EccB
MALNLASGLQVSAHFFWNRRNAAALSHHGVRMEFDPVQRQRASLILGFVFAILAVALMFVLSWFKPAGQVGQSSILADRDTGAVYVLVDGRLHPAVNLVSARLIAGQASNPTFVKANELAKYPQGPSVGIAGAPTAMPLSGLAPCRSSRRRRCSPRTTTRPTWCGTASGPKSICPTRR